MMQNTALIGDIGGTNARLAISTPEGMQDIKEYRCTEFGGPGAIIQAYCDSLGLAEKPHNGVFAVAGPADDPSKIIFTNGPWKQQPLDFTNMDIENMQTLNDFAAVSYSVAELTPNDCIVITSGSEPFYPSSILDKTAPPPPSARMMETSPSQRFVTIGPGTGLGVSSGLVTKTGQFLVIGGEAGHASFAPDTEEEWKVKEYLENQFNMFVDVETMASGTGMVIAFNAIAHVRQIDKRISDASEVTPLVHDSNKGTREAAKWTLSVFAKAMGSCASSVALTNNARTVFVAGGVVAKLSSYFDQAKFTEAFRSNNMGNSNILKDVPVLRITHPQPGLLGAHSYFQLNR